MKEEDIEAVATALQAYDSTVENKSWRDLAIVAISAMAARDYKAAKTPQVIDDPLERQTALVAHLHRKVKVNTFGEAKLLDAVSEEIMGAAQYRLWSESQN